MNEQNNYAIKFNEEHYATKDDVKKYFNMSSVDQFWKIIVDYRKAHTETLELPSIDRTKFSLVLTNNITNRILFLERNFMKAFMKYIQLSSGSKEAFKHIRYKKILGSISKDLGIEHLEGFLDSMIANNVSTIPTELLSTDNYLKALEYIEHFDSKTIGYQDFNSLNNILNLGHVDLENIEEKQYRTTELEQPHYYQTGYIYKCATLDRVNDMVNNLVEFMNDDNEYGIVRSVATLFYYQYIMPYEYFNEENTCLACKLIANKVGYSSFASFINVESLLLNKDPIFENVKSTVQKTLDITYYFDFVLNFLKDDLEDIEDDLSLAIKEEVKYVSNFEEQKEEVTEEKEVESTVDSEIKEPTTEVLEEIKNEVVREQQLNLYGETSVALPVFPRGLNDNEVEKIIVDLMETYPTLRKTQAHFYARHCTIGKYYTIQQFKDEEETSYETARTSMDFLVELGFYSKSKLRNKFVYKPVPRR